jgi:hypothetical protein
MSRYGRNVLQCVGYRVAVYMKVGPRDLGTTFLPTPSHMEQLAVTIIGRLSRETTKRKCVLIEMYLLLS